MKNNKPNRRIVMVVLIMFITITFASFNTNLFIDGRAYVRAEDLVRITNIELIDATEQAFETYNPEYTADTIAINANLPKQNSTAQYRITITNNSDYDYDVQNIAEQKYSNTNISYEIVGLVKDSTVLEAHTSSTFLLNLSNNTTINEEEDVYQTKSYGFEYTGGEQEFVAPYDGEYTLEVWGAQGQSNSNGRNGGYGGYSVGKVTLKKNEKIYISVGQKGARQVQEFGGGGIGDLGGGGATHISTMSGKLQNLEIYKHSILIVAGGGGGNDTCYTTIVSGGGFKGNDGANGSNILPGGSQSPGNTNSNSSGSFGLGGNSKVRAIENVDSAGAGGGGYYGGTGSYGSGGCGAGGSGYIGNTRLSDKSMYCYQCEESTEESTKTISTDNYSSTATSQYAKEGNGYAKITFNRKIEDGSDYDFKYTGGQQTLTVPYTGIYKLETWGAQGGTQDNAKTRDGFGGYSTGKIKLSKNDILYINVGGQGKDYCDSKDGKRVFFTGGYNGGGDGATWIDNKCGGSGGGATHIATTSGQLSELEESKDSILIVSGGGGGFDGQTGSYLGTGGSGGGYTGNNGTSQSGNYIGTGGTQTQGGINFNQATSSRFSHDGLFGLGGSAIQPSQVENGGNISGGGGGYYGGGGGCGNGGYGGGGSGYIGNASLFEKVMYCFNCQESQDFETKTVTTSSHSKEPQQNIPKEGNGYSRITLVQRQSNSIELSLKFYIKRLTDYEITYKLNGGTISGEKTTYTRNTDTFTIPTPEREGYTFTGWSGGKNLFDKNNVEVIEAYISPELPEITASNANRLFIMPIEANTTYVVSKLKGAQLQLAYTESHPSVGTEVLGQTGYHATIYNYNDTTRHYITITTGETAKYLVCRFNQTYQDTITTQQFMDSIQVEIGTKPTAYESYVNSSSVTIQKGSRGNRVYNANWSANTYNISYDLDGGTISNEPTTYTPDSSNISVPRPTKIGYTFTGWTGGKNLYDVNTITYTQNRRLNLETGEIEERGDNNWRVSDFIPVTGKRNYVLSGNLTPSGWNMRICLYDSDKHFIKSINYSNSGTHEKNYPITADQDIYYIRVQAYFNGNYDTAYDGSTVQIEEGTIKTSYEPYLSSLTKNLEIASGSTGNRHYVANWEKNEYTIEYDLDGGTISNEPTSYDPDTETFTLPTPTKAGYEFVGWTGGKNLFEMKNTSTTIAGITFTVNADKSITINGTSTDYVYYTLSAEGASIANGYSPSHNIELEPNTKYYFNGTAAGDYLVECKIKVDGANIWPKGSFTTDSSGEKAAVYFYIKNNRTVNNLTIYPQLEKGKAFTGYEQYISTPQSVTIPKGSAGNRIYHAVWRDNTTPTLSLSKDTYIEGFNGWTINNGYVDGDGILILGEDGNDAETQFKYVTNGGKWYPEYEFLTTSSSPYFSPTGGIHNNMMYYDVNNVRTESSQGSTGNGVAFGGEVDQWTSSLTEPRFTSKIHGHGGNINNIYFRFNVSPTSDYSRPVVKVRNFKMHCEDMPNSFYDILITSSDNVGVTTTKYAAGSQNVNYFKTNGTVINGNSIRVTSNGIYTVYVEDAAGNGKVAEIEITNIQ